MIGQTEYKIMQFMYDYFVSGQLGNKQAASTYNSLFVSLVIIITYLDKHTYTYVCVCM